MSRVFIGVDPHKLSATIEVVDETETVLATGRFATDKAGYAARPRHVSSYPDRVWAVEGSNGAGRPLAQPPSHPGRFTPWKGFTTTIGYRPVYAAIFIDAVHGKIRDGQVANRPIYDAIGVTLTGGD